MKNKIFPAKEEALPEVLDFTERTLEDFECSVKNQTAICVAIEEVFVNIAHYAYPETEGDVALNIKLDSQSNSVEFRISDKGVPFNPLEKPDPDITLSAEEREVGGLGIFIAKKTMDSLSYAYKDNKNILTMTKKI